MPSTSSLSSAPSEIAGTEVMGPVSGVLPSWPRRILVAAHGLPSAEPAIVAAHALAARTGATLELLTVYPPEVALPASPTRPGIEQCEAADREEARSLVLAVERQRQRALHERFGSPTHVEVGDPGPTILRRAAQAGADLVMVGIGREAPADRRAGGRTPMVIAQHLDIPLYVVAHGCETPERCLIVFADGRPHGSTIRAALACLARGSHVWIIIPDAAASNAAFDEIPIARVAISGDMLSGTLRIADRLRAQLIALPMHGAPGPVRSFLPNLVDPLVLAARCSVLVVPAAPEAGTTSTH